MAAALSVFLLLRSVASNTVPAMALCMWMVLLVSLSSLSRDAHRVRDLVPSLHVPRTTPDAAARPVHHADRDLVAHAAVAQVLRAGIAELGDVVERGELEQAVEGHACSNWHGLKFARSPSGKRTRTHTSLL